MTLTRNSATEVTIDAAGGGETYDLNATQDGSNVDLNLRSTSGTDNSVVQLTAGDNITLTRNSATEVTIAGNAGTVTSVTGTAPVVSSGGTTPAISMAAATTSVNGYLTSTNWNTFNNKIGGGITAGQVAYGDTTSDTIKGETAFSYDDTVDTLTAGTFSGQYEGLVGINPATPDSAIRTPLRLLVGSAQLSGGVVNVRSFQSTITSNTLGADLFVTICATDSPQGGVDITCAGLLGGVLTFESTGGTGSEIIMFHIWYADA